MNATTTVNNSALFMIKKIFNDKIYKHALTLYKSEGENAALAYVQQYVKSDIRELLKLS